MKRAAFLAAALLVLAGCSSAPPPVRVPAAPVSSEAAIDTTLLLVGDAGEPAAPEPVLVALAREAGRSPARTTVVFLGDNVYPLGVPAEGAPDRAEAERRLRAQVDAVRDAGARALFIPGNHDWTQGGADGWERVKREGALVEAWGARMEPKNGCPGPVTIDLGARVRLVALDTQWWLHPFAKPSDAASGCEAFNEVAVGAALGKAVGDEAGDRAVVVLAHHPLETGGPHGGYFTFADHVFPLQNLVPWLWLPLPGLGSIYPLARNSGISPQDLSGTANRRMRESLIRALSSRAPLVYASGHEHNLQVLLPGEKSLPRALLVSGAGIHGDTSPVARRPSTVFARSAAGFQRIDVMKNRGARLSVLEVDEHGRAAEVFSAWLEKER